jgi:hypothetical protein
VAGGITRWNPPEFLPQDNEPTILFLDELPQAPPLVQSSLLQLILDRRLGEYSAPSKTYIMAAGNRAEDRTGSHRLSSALLNRFIHIDFEMSNEDWQEWAAANGVAPEIRAFLRLRSHLLFDFKPESNPRSFPTPRTWAYVSEILHVTPAHLQQSVVAGCVGDGPAAEFMGFLKLYQQLPDIDQVLTNPKTTPVPKEPSVLYALVSALADTLKKKKSLANAYVQFATRLPDEFSMLALREALSVDKMLITNPLVSQWVNTARAKGMFAGA